MRRICSNQSTKSATTILQSHTTVGRCSGCHHFFATSSPEPLRSLSQCMMHRLQGKSGMWATEPPLLLIGQRWFPCKPPTSAALLASCVHQRSKQMHVVSSVLELRRPGTDAFRFRMSGSKAQGKSIWYVHTYIYTLSGKSRTQQICKGLPACIARRSFVRHLSKGTSPKQDRLEYQGRPTNALLTLASLFVSISKSSVLLRDQRMDEVASAPGKRTSLTRLRGLVHHRVSPPEVGESCQSAHFHSTMTVQGFHQSFWRW